MLEMLSVDKALLVIASQTHRATDVKVRMGCMYNQVKRYCHIGEDPANRSRTTPFPVLELYLPSLLPPPRGALVIPVLSFTYKPANPGSRLSLTYAQKWLPRYCK